MRVESCRSGRLHGNHLFFLSHRECREWEVLHWSRRLARRISRMKTNQKGQKKTPFRPLNDGVKRAKKRKAADVNDCRSRSCRCEHSSNRSIDQAVKPAINSFIRSVFFETRETPKRNWSLPLPHTHTHTKWIQIEVWTFWCPPTKCVNSDRKNPSSTADTIRRNEQKKVQVWRPSRYPCRASLYSFCDSTLIVNEKTRRPSPQSISLWRYRRAEETKTGRSLYKDGRVDEPLCHRPSKNRSTLGADNSTDNLDPIRSRDDVDSSAAAGRLFLLAGRRRRRPTSVQHAARPAPQSLGRSRESLQKHSKKPGNKKPDDDNGNHFWYPSIQWKPIAEWLFEIQK